MKTYGGRSITIQGERFNIHLARQTHCCFQCGANLKITGHGLKCGDVPYHYGMISRKSRVLLIKKGGEEMALIEMRKMFPNKTGKMRGIDMTGPQVMTVKNIAMIEEDKFQSREKELNCYFSFLETPYRVKVTVTNGYELMEEWGDPAKVDWVGKKALVITLKEKGHNVVRVQASDQAAQPVLNISSFSKVELFNHCYNTLSVWNEPFDKNQMGQLMSYVLEISSLNNGEFEPQNAYNEMVALGIPLHRFLNSLDDYDSGLSWLQAQFDESNFVYTVDVEEGLRQAIAKSLAPISDEENFYNQIMSEIPFYENHAIIEFTMGELGLQFEVEKSDTIYNHLNDHASKMADTAA